MVNIYRIIHWEDDNQDDKEADEIWGGPNYELSLTENGLNIGKQLAKICEENGGRINNEANVVLSILSRHDKKFPNYLKLYLRTPT